MQRILTGFKSWAGERWVMVDFHIHSSYSDGSLTSSEILKMSQYSLLDAVAISDHCNVSGAYEGRLLAATDIQMPLVLISQEITLGNHFHFLLLGGSQKSWGEVGRNRLIKKFAEHYQSGGVAVLAHPWTMSKSSWARGFLKEILAWNFLTAVELYNSTILEMTPRNLKAFKTFWEEYLAPSNLAIVGGSDFHYFRQGRYPGSGRTYLKISYPGEKGILEAIRNRRCVAGLFSHRSFDLGWLGAGQGVLFGREPWLGELQRLKEQIKIIINRKFFLKPALKRYLGILYNNGYYPILQELLI